MGQLLTHQQTGTVNRDAIEDGVWSGEVDVLKDVWSVGLERNDLLENGEHLILADDDGFSGEDVSVDLVAMGFENDGLGREHVVSLAVVLESLTNEQGTDTVRVSEANDTVPGQHGDACVGAPDSVVDAFKGLEDIVFVDSRLVIGGQLGGKQVEKQLRVRVGVDVSVHDLVHVLL